MQRKLTFILILISVFFLIWTKTSWRENFLTWKYDRSNHQTPITSSQQIKDFLNSFPVVSISKADKEYLVKTKYQEVKYKKLAKGSQLLVIKGNDIFKYVVGKYRIKDFLPNDDYYFKNINSLLFGNGSEIYWMVDKKLLFKLLELQNVLAKKGFNQSGFTIVNGYRHPAYNEYVGGAPLSRHLKGQALDLLIGDINNDGVANQKDKSIVLDFLEKDVIKSFGGIGRYPGSMSVHFDVRGYRARWDQQ